jgi:hypothetical protein
LILFNPIKMRQIKGKINLQSDSLLSYYGFTKAEQKKYPVVAGILKQLTPERIKKEIEKIQKVELPPELQKWVREYEKVGDRDEYIWKWSYLGWKIFTLSCVDEKYKKSVVVTKIYSTILNALVDDLADKMQNEIMLSEVSSTILNNNKNLSNFSSETNRNYLFLIEKIWNLVNKIIKQYPRYKDFKDIFTYDYKQYLNTIQYSYLIIKNPALINLIEHEMYSPHNMQMIIGATIDLMCSSGFNAQKLGVLRTINWNTQQMGRIGNLITTWQDEIYDDNDFTSGIFAYALDKGVISAEDLNKKENLKKAIRKIKTSEAEKYFLKQWEDCYNNIDKLNKNIKDVNIKKILSGSEEFLIMHLTSRGLEI